MKILLFGGTTEGRQLTEALVSQGHKVTVCVATDLGAEELKGISGADIRPGRLPIDGIRELLPAYDLCVDATHPYAVHISRSIKTACEECSLPLRRVLRKASPSEGLATFPTQQTAADYLCGTEGPVLLTTGTREISAYRKIPPERLYARILPTCEGLEACEEAGLPHRNIIAMQGPFSTELNAAILRQYGIRWLVTKDGGEAGGFPEKLEAARLTGTQVILIARPEEEGIPVEELLEELAAWPAKHEESCSPERN